MFHRAKPIERLFVETSVVEFTAEALLGTPGETMVSDARLRLIRFGIGSGAPVGTPLRRGIIFAAAVGK